MRRSVAFGSDFMIFIADYFALALVVILFMFFFDNKSKMRYMPAPSRVFAGVLALTALNAATDLLTGGLLVSRDIPLWLNVFVNSFYFFVNIVTTSCIALYLFMKILEHTHRRHCRRNAYIGLSAILAVYMLVIVLNLKTGVLFYFNEQGEYCRGPLNALGYILTLVQMVLVLICYFRNRETTSRPMRRALINVFPIIPVCIIIQRLFPEIMLNSIIIALVDVVLFMTFMSQRHGVHSLTELNDRHRFFDEVERLIAKQEPFQIYLINLKNFSAVNRKFGHLIGDEYLYQFAFSLEKTLKGSMAFHMNGTVFAIVMRYTYQSVAEKQTSALLEFLDKGVDFDQYHIEADYFVANYVADGTETTATDIYEVLEYSVTRAVALKQKYVLCTVNMRDEKERRRYLRERLKKIDRTSGFEVWYQPIKCMSTGRFCSMEALIRLREPSGELISPVEFIPLAEETGQINAITWFVLEETCKHLRRSPELEGVSVSINLPMEQMMETDFVSRFIDVVDQAGVEHRRICIEFTERTILDNFRQIKSTMEELTDSGFRFYLDDFGVGYSNFNCLLQLPFQIIKFDAEFLRQQKNGVRDYSTVQALTKLLHGMNLTVVAEGVETPDEVESLDQIGIDRIQGYVFARPMAEKDVLRFYREEQSFR